MKRGCIFYFSVLNENIYPTQVRNKINEKKTFIKNNKFYDGKDI